MALKGYDTEMYNKRMKHTKMTERRIQNLVKHIRLSFQKFMLNVYHTPLDNVAKKITLKILNNSQEKSYD